MGLVNNILSILNKLPIPFLQKESKKRLIEDTFKDKKRGAAKMRDFDSMNMESSLPYYIMPSMMYTFMYMEKDQVVSTQTFHDAMPIVLCLQAKSDYLTGINMNLLTMKMREKFLYELDNMFDHFYTDKAPEFWQEEQKLLVNQKLFNLVSGKGGIGRFIYLMSNAMGLNISYCYRRYNIPSMREIHYVEYSDYQYIPTLDITNSVENFDSKMAFVLNSAIQAKSKNIESYIGKVDIYKVK